MQNYTKSQTRLAFVQYIFQNEFLKINAFESENIEDFKKHFYDTNIATIEENKEFKLKFNKNFLRKLSENYINNFNSKEIISKLNSHIKLNRKIENWNSVLKSVIFALISELEITDE